MAKMILPVGNNDNVDIPEGGANDNGADGKPFVEEVDLGNDKSAEEIAAEAAEAAAAQALVDAAAAADGNDGTDKRTPEEIAAELDAKRIADEEAAAAAQEEVTEVQIGDDVFTLDADGNAINEAGEIAHTAEQLATYTADDAGGDAGEFELATLSQIQPVDTEGNAIAYDNTPDGRRQYVEDVYQAGGIDRANQILEDRYERFPVMKVVNDYIIANGSLDGFNEQSFVRTPITAESKDEELIATIRAAKLMKGDSEAEIANIISWAKSDNKLLDHAKMSDQYLAQSEAKAKAELAQQAEQAETARLERNQRYVSDLTNSITNGKITVGGKDLVIPSILEVQTENGKRVADRSELIKYATQINQYKMPDGSIQNATQYQIDKYMKQTNKNINDDIYEMVSLFTKQDNAQILKSAINNNAAETVRKRIKLTRPVAKAGANGGGKGTIKLKYPSRK